MNIQKCRAAGVLVAIATLLGGCSTLPNRESYDFDDLKNAQVVGFPADIRIWGDAAFDVLRKEVNIVWAQERRAMGIANGRLAPLHMLALSGGGEDGAFGAGLLVGWTQHGDRPTFDIVTGVSAGSLVAPFAFVGSSQDANLREAFTTIDKSKILIRQSILQVLSGEAVATTAPLREMVGRFVTPELFGTVAAEHLKGRRLFVVTTHLDSQRPVLWDMGKIANSDNPQAMALFREVLVASAAVPGILPPVYLDVQSGNRRFREMHVDGGVTAQVYAIPLEAGAAVLSSGPGRERHIYVIINNRVAPQFDLARRSLLSIAGRSISTLIKMQGASGARDIYHFSRSVNADFNLAYVDKDFTEVTPEPFDRGYMNRLFTYGYDLGRQGYPWKKLPPGLDAGAPLPGHLAPRPLVPRATLPSSTVPVALAR